MIKNRNILILAAVLLVLLGISLVQKAGYKKSTSRSSTDKVVAGTFTADQLDRITLGYGQDNESVVLMSTPTGWVVASAWDAPASMGRIDGLLRNLSDLSGEFRSDNNSVLGDYGLSDDVAVKVRAYGKDGELALAVDIGNKPERVPGNFIKRPDSNEVYLTAVDLLGQLGLYDGPAKPGNKHFLDLQAVQADRLAVNRVILRDNGGNLEMAKEFAEAKPVPGPESTPPAVEPGADDRTTWEWKLVTPKTMALAKTKVDGVLNSLVGIRAVDVADPTADPAAYGLADPLRTATLMMEDGSDLILEFGNLREAEGDLQAGVWMKVQGQRSVWIVTEYTVNNIFKKVEELQPDQE